MARKKFNNSVTLFAVRPIMIIIVIMMLMMMMMMIFDTLQITVAALAGR